MSKFFTLLCIAVYGFANAQARYSVETIPAALLVNANSVLFDELTEIDITNDAKMIRNYSRATTVLNKYGDRYTGSYISYDNETKVKNVEVYIYNSDGFEIEHFKERDFKDVSAADGFSIYKDDRILYIDYTPTAYPYTLVFKSEIETSDTAFLYPWYPVKGYASSTKNSVFKIQYNPDNKPKKNEENLEGFNITYSDNPQEIICSATEIKAIKYEDLSPGFKNLAPHISFALNDFYLKGVRGNGKNWTDFGNWMQSNLLSDVDDLPLSTINTVKTLVRDEPTNAAKARKIYEYLQNKVRYISIQIGIGGWKPMLASEVDKLGYGDCKALTNYTKALLDAVGIPSYYTVLYAGSEEMDISKDFSSLQGNHVMLGIPDNGDISWLECTSQDLPYGFIGNFTDDRDVLIITPEGGKITHTKKYDFNENLQTNTIEVQLNGDRSVNTNFTSISEGLQYDDKFLNTKKTEQELESLLKNRWSYINGFKIKESKLSNDRKNVKYKEELKIDIPGYLTPVGDDFLFCVNIFNQSQNIPERYKSRKHNLYISEGFIDTDNVEINLPDGYVLDSMPEDQTIENKFGSYSIQFKKTSENKINYTRNLLIKKGTFPPEEYKNYRNFRRKIAKLDKTKILLLKE